ncbi:MAG: dephospho-CoA kinase [Candidatus Latescibacterota bacterium]
MVVGVTGGIASGKTTVCRMFEAQGAKVVDADRIGHAVVEEDAQVLDAIRSAFGSDMLTGGGTLDRVKMGKQVFSDPEAKAKLEHIVHPPLLLRLREAIRQALGEDPDRPVVVDAALIVECGIVDWFDVVVAVRVSEEKRIERLMQRNRLSMKEALNRIRSQMPEAEKIGAATFVIRNDGDMEELEQRAREVWSGVGTRSGKKG